MYGSQPPPHYPPGAYHQSPAPPQPEWHPSQSTPSPQPPWHQAPLPPLPPPPPPPPPPPALPFTASSTYNPNVYGPMPGGQSAAANSPHSTIPEGTPNADRTTWGVRYNRHHGHPSPTPPPPLPPRVGSSADNHYAPPQSQSHSPTAPSWTAPQTDGLLAPMNSTDSASGQVQAGTQPPPPPPPPPRPPVPPAYQNEIQQSAQVWQQTYPSQYSDYPPTHRYEPQQQTSQPPLASGPGQYTNYEPQSATGFDWRHHAPSLAERPLPPPPTSAFPGQAHLGATSTSLESPSFVASASALGGGGPSDWEYLSSIPGVVDDTGAFPSKVQGAQRPSSAVEAPLTSTHAPAVPPARRSSQTNTQRQTERPHPAQAESWSSSPVENADPKQQGSSHPVHPPRNDSLQSGVSADDCSATIDGVIQAWTQPISPEVKPQTDFSQQSPVSPAEQSPSGTEMREEQPSTQGKAADEPQVASAIKTVPAAEHGPSPPQNSIATTASMGLKQEMAPSQVVKVIDPYEDLDPWFKSSLVRYVAMLRKEAVAESDEERYRIFTGFVAKETKLREVLYNVEHQDKDEVQTSVPSGTIEPPSRSKSVGASPTVDSGLIPVESEEQTKEKRHQVAKLDIIPSETPGEKEDIAYSPGGRPILSDLAATAGTENWAGLQRSASNPTGRSQSASSDFPGNQQAGLRGNSFSLSSGVFPRSTSVPPPSISRPLAGMPPLISEPPRPAYVPFRYSEGPQRGSDNLIIDRPAYQAYSALRQASAESGRAMSFTPAPQAPSRAGTVSISPVRGEHDETFLGIIREKSVSYRGRRLEVGSGGVIEELGALIPVPFPTQEDSPENMSIRKEMEKFPDDFGYIKEAIDNWEQAAKDRRAKLDKERAARQEESEKHIDALFNDKDIGYADINPLEEEFRQKEARAQLEEERRELNDFMRKVFNPLDTRLKEEIVELKALYQRAIDELDSGSNKTSGRDAAKYRLSHTMKTVNDLSSKLEIRFQKRLDIALDRERRRKKAERRPLVSLGDSAALKKLDGDFDRMEKRNILEAAKDRDERANKLTDSFDGAIMYGLGDHQRLVDDIAAKTKKLDAGMVQHSGLSESDTELLLRSVSALVRLLRDDSESMLESFGKADSLLNDADYCVSVAEARYSNAGADVFRRLDEEKKKEDAKIRQDLELKLESVRKGPSEIQVKIDSLLRSMGKDSGPGPGPWRRPAAVVVAAPTIPSDTTATQHPGESLMPGPRPGSVPPVLGEVDPELEQKERLRKALEEAKRRNAAKNFSS